ncbi:hypothetical protein [Streptomyces sp. NPDC059893]|uniref:hypothetical protein n=1 Tax=Streptomyces sp. NPDC059893 TaxID=3346990 RepID=UPI0036561387
MRQDSGAPRILLCPTSGGPRVAELRGVHVERGVLRELEVSFSSEGSKDPDSDPLT